MIFTWHFSRSFKTMYWVDSRVGSKLHKAMSHRAWTLVKWKGSCIEYLQFQWLVISSAVAFLPPAACAPSAAPEKKLSKLFYDIISAQCNQFNGRKLYMGSNISCSHYLWKYSLTSTEATWASGKLWDCMQMHLQLESHVQMLMSVLCNDTILYFLYMSRHLFLYRHIKSFHNV